MSSTEEKHSEKTREETTLSVRNDSELRYVPVAEEYAKVIESVFPFRTPVEVHPGGVIVPDKYQQYGELILNMQVRHDDVWVVSYVRTGSTWTQEIVWCIANDLDFHRAKFLQLIRAHLLEQTILDIPKYDGIFEENNSIDLTEKDVSSRFIKTHLPIQLLPKSIQKVKPKIVYVARNPKDVCVSLYHYYQLFNKLNFSFEYFCELFIKGKVLYGSCITHMLDFWKQRNEPNVLFIKYEDLKEDLEGGIKQIAEFLDKPLSAADIKKLAEYVSFKNMRNNKAVNLEPYLEFLRGEDFANIKHEQHFIRKGEIGDWKNHMTDDMAASFDAWMEEHFHGTGLQFK